MNNSFSPYSYPKIKDPKTFEALCCDVLNQIYYDECYHFSLYGRNGQKQKGIDICTHYPMEKGGYIVAQCKNYIYANGLDKAKRETFQDIIKKDLLATEALSYKVGKFIVMTALDRDTGIQDLNFDMNMENPHVDIEIMFWDNIEAILSKNKAICQRYYPGMAASRMNKRLTRNIPVAEVLFGRQEEIKVLESMVSDGRNHIWINGLGGLGKSTLAKGYLTKHINDYDHIGWIDYQNDLKTSFLQAFKMDIVENTHNEVHNDELRFQYIWDRLSENAGKLLIVIDNVVANTYTDPYISKITTWENATILITSRGECVDPYENVELGFLSEESCVELFLKYSLKNREKNKDIISSLVKRAYYHTLTVEILGKAARHGSLIQFDKRLREHGFTEAKQSVPTAIAPKGKKIIEHLRMLYDFNAFQTGSEPSRILWNFAMIPFSEIPEEAIDWMQIDGNVLSELIEGGWISQHEDTYSMHDLVKEIIFFDMEDGHAPDGIADIFLQYVADKDQDFILPDEDYTEKRDKIIILKTILGYMKCDKTDILASAYHRLGKELFEAGEYITAEEYSLKALEIREELYGSMHLQTAKTYNNLGNLYMALKKFEIAKEYLLKDLNVAETILGKDDLFTAVSCNNLGMLYQYTKEYETSESYYLREISIVTQHHGKIHIDRATAFSNLGSLYYEMKKYNEALNCYKEALAILDKLPDNVEGLLGVLYYNMSSLSIINGEPATAISYLVLAFKLSLKKHGFKHPYTKKIKRNLQEIFMIDGKTEDDFFNFMLSNLTQEECELII